MYGPNAEKPYKEVKPILEITDFTKGVFATLRFGGPGSGAKEIEIETGSKQIVPNNLCAPLPDTN